MGDQRTQYTIWQFVGGVSAISGFTCFTLSSTYKRTFGKIGSQGLISYLFLCLTTGCLILLAKRIPVPHKVKSVLGTIFFVAICSISVVLEKYVPGKSDPYAIISYGSFGLMSLSLSKKLELGFETGFSAFFLQLFASQLFEIKWFFFPVALVFCSLIMILRHYSESRELHIDDEEMSQRSGDFGYLTDPEVLLHRPNQINPMDGQDYWYL